MNQTESDVEPVFGLALNIAMEWASQGFFVQFQESSSTFLS